MRLARYDSIIIGAGHNGLVCAAYLAQSGQRVLVLEASDAAGGLGASREFHPGFHASVAHSVSHFSKKVADDLKLSSYGYKTTSNSLPTIGLSVDEEHVVVREGSISGVSAEDADAYQDYSRLMHRFADALNPSWLKTMPRIGSTGLSDLITLGRLGLNIRMLRKEDMREFMRIATLPARDLMDEYFDNDLLKATLSWDGLIGSKRAPRSPNGAVLAMLYRMAGESRGAHSIPGRSQRSDAGIVRISDGIRSRNQMCRGGKSCAYRWQYRWPACDGRATGGWGKDRGRSHYLGD